jgi:hypothetical protein
VNIFWPVNYGNWRALYKLPLIQNLPMKPSTTGRIPTPPYSEQQSEALLKQKMGLSGREIQEVYLKYGVSAARLVELMQLSKYQFVYTGKIEGLCEPCTIIRKIQPSN